MKKIIVIILLFSVIISCERDDICPEATATTPHLIIRFYDVTELTETKRVINLQIHGLDDDGNELELYQSVTSSDSLAIPLRTIDNDTNDENGITTKFKLHKEYEIDGNDNISGNPDIIAITYDTEDIYVSRACGYKTIFNNVELILTTDDDNWIELIQIEEPLIIDDESAAHVQIFH